MSIHWHELLGYLAGLCLLATYSMKTMIPLRMAGIVSNCFFIIYGAFSSVYPTLILHVLLLPLNSIRLHQMLQPAKEVREASRGNLSMDWLKPFMTSRRTWQGNILFRKGDLADAMYYVVGGRYRLVELDANVQRGQIVGELGLLAPDRRPYAMAATLFAGADRVIE